jgi:hypothetical protein
MVCNNYAICANSIEIHTNLDIIINIKVSIINGSFLFRLRLTRIFNAVIGGKQRHHGRTGRPDLSVIAEHVVVQVVLGAGRGVAVAAHGEVDTLSCETL